MHRFIELCKTDAYVFGGFAITHRMLAMFRKYANKTNPLAKAPSHV